MTPIYTIFLCYLVKAWERVRSQGRQCHMRTIIVEFFECQHTQPTLLCNARWTIINRETLTANNKIILIDNTPTWSL